MNPPRNRENIPLLHDPIGLCKTCQHARPIPHPRGGTAYWQCGRAAEDLRYPRYPRLPVTQCPGFEKCA